MDESKERGLHRSLHRRCIVALTNSVGVSYPISRLASSRAKLRNLQRAAIGAELNCGNIHSDLRTRMRSVMKPRNVGETRGKQEIIPLIGRLGCGCSSFFVPVRARRKRSTGIRTMCILNKLPRSAATSRRPVSAIEQRVPCFQLLGQRHIDTRVPLNLTAWCRDLLRGIARSQPSTRLAVDIEQINLSPLGRGELRSPA